MSDDSVYKEIEELERRLADLRRTLQPCAEWNPPTPVDRENGEKFGDPFIIRSKDELELAALPDLARLILDALPVQVFIKEEKIRDAGAGRTGRKYTYLNKRAKDLNRWPAEAVLGKYDCEVFASDERGRRLYERMQSQETDTIRNGESRITVTDWTQSSGAWNRNLNIEIPIQDMSGTTIGFCSVAHDLMFQALPREWAKYQGLTQHHYKNLLNLVTRRVTSALGHLEEIEAVPGIPKEAPASVRAELEMMRQALRVVDRTSKLQVLALGSIGRYDKPAMGKTDRSIGRIIEVLKSTYDNCGLLLEPCEVLEGDPNTLIFEPDIVTAILTVLINNALKFSGRPDGSGECSITCRVVDKTVVWEASNPCNPDDNLTRELNIDGSDDSELENAVHEGFDRFIISIFLKNAFPGRSPRDVFIPPKKPYNGRFLATLITEIDANASVIN